MSECSICRVPYSPESFYLRGHLYQPEDGSSEGVLHLFDEACIVSWLKNNPHCPLCRKALPIKDLMSYKNPNYSTFYGIIGGVKETGRFVWQNAEKMLAPCRWLIKGAQEIGAFVWQNADQVLPVLSPVAVGFAGMKSGAWALQLANEAEMPIPMEGVIAMTTATLTTAVTTQVRRSFGIAPPLLGQIFPVAGLSTVIGMIAGIYTSCNGFDRSAPEAIGTLLSALATAFAIPAIYDNALGKFWDLDDFIEVVFTLSLMTPIIGAIAGGSMASTKNIAIIQITQVVAFAALGFYITHKAMKYFSNWREGAPTTLSE